MSSGALGANDTFPRFRFSIGLVTGKRYRVTARLSMSPGPSGTPALKYFRVGYDNLVPWLNYVEGDKVLVDLVTTVLGDPVLELDLRGNLPDASVTIESLSIREDAFTPTNNNFVSGDYNRETGLKGDGVSKSLFYSGLSFAQQADNSLSLFMTEAFTLTARWSLGFNAETSLGTAGAGLVTFRNSNSAGSNIATGTAPVLLGVSRSSASAWELFTNNAASTITQNSTSTASLGSFRVFGQGASGSALSDFRLAFYHAGTSIDLSMLNARVSALITAIGAAI
jgi:hypothetical protein